MKPEVWRGERRNSTTTTTHILYYVMRRKVLDKEERLKRRKRRRRDDDDDDDDDDNGVKVEICGMNVNVKSKEWKKRVRSGNSMSSFIAYIVISTT